MIDEKNLDPDAADRIGNLVRMSGGVELIETLLTTDLVSLKLFTHVSKKSAAKVLWDLNNEHLNTENI